MLSRTFFSIRFVCLLALGALGGLLLYRVLHIPVTHDEGITWFFYVGKSFGDIQRAGSDAIANNHFLNTLLTKVSIGALGDTPLALRLPNVLACVAYGVFGYGCLSQIAQRHTRWLWHGLLWLFLNPFLFDFWGLCRGYGLSIGFVVGSLYFFLRFVRGAQGTHAWLTLLMAALAVWSNLPALNFMVAISALMLLECLVLGTRSGRARRAVSLFSAFLFFYGALALLLYAPVKTLVENKEFYFGGNTGFIQDTLGSLLRESSGVSPQAAIVIGYVVTAQALAAAGFWMRQVARKTQDANARFGLYLTLTCLIAAASTVVQHHLFGTLYLIERTALFFYPIYVLQLTCLLLRLLPGIGCWIASVVTVLLLVNFITNLNPTATRTWAYDSQTTAILRRIAMRERERLTERIRLRTDWLFAPSFRFHTTTEYHNTFEPVQDIRSAIEPDTSYHYYLIHKDDSALPGTRYSIDTAYLLGGGPYILLRRK